MRSIEELNEFTQKAFKTITAKEPRELNDLERAFLVARSEYLGIDLKEKFAEVLEPKKAEKKTEKKAEPKKSEE